MNEIANTIEKIDDLLEEKDIEYDGPDTTELLKGIDFEKMEEAKEILLTIAKDKDKFGREFLNLSHEYDTLAAKIEGAAEYSTEHIYLTMQLYDCGHRIQELLRLRSLHADDVRSAGNNSWYIGGMPTAFREADPNATFTIEV